MSNLVVNPSFENGGSDPPTSWDNFNAGTITRGVATDQKHTGSSSWKISTTSGTGDAGINNSSNPVTIVPGTVVKVSAWIKTALSVGQAHIHIKIFKAGYADVLEYDTPAVLGTTDWTFNSKNIVVPTSYVIMEVWLACGSWGAAFTGDIWFDDVSVDTTTNLVDDGGVEESEWDEHWPSYTSSGSHTDSRDVTTVYDGVSSFKIVASGGACDGGVSQSWTQNLAFNNVPAGTYTVSAWVKTGASVTNAHFVIRNEWGDVLFQSHITTANQDWTQISGTFVMDGVDDMEILMGLGSYGAASDGTAYFDNINIYLPSSDTVKELSALGVG